jgi:hypothetical protein
MLDRFRYAFFVDGSLRDVYVFNTTMDDWRKLFDELHSGGYDLDFEMGEVRELPTDPDDIVERYTRKGVPLTEPCPRLKIRIGTNSLNFFFHSVDPLEFDLSPKDVTSDQSLNDLFGFMRRVGKILGKDVVLTDEAIRDSALLRYSHGKDEFVEAKRPETEVEGRSVLDVLRRLGEGLD